MGSHLKGTTNSTTVLAAVVALASLAFFSWDKQATSSKQMLCRSAVLDERQGFMAEPWASAAGARALDSEGSVFALDGLVSDEQAEHLQSLFLPLARMARAMGDPEAADHQKALRIMSQHAVRHHLGYASISFNATKMTFDPVMRALAARVADVTGIPETPMDDWLLSLSFPPPAEMGLHLEGLHLDQNHKPERVVSLLIQLSGPKVCKRELCDKQTSKGQPAIKRVQGGQTIFPCLRLASDQGHAQIGPRVGENGGAGTRVPHPPATRAKLCGWLQQIYMQHKPIGLEPAKFFVNFSLPSESQHAAEVDSLCQAPPKDLLQLQPKRGASLLFLTQHPRSQALLSHMWHGGCPVVDGEKLLLIAFKSLKRSASC